MLSDVEGNEIWVGLC